MVSHEHPSASSRDTAPAVRARALKDTLEFLDAHRPELARTMEVELDPETLCTIREALPMDWISASMSRGLIEVIVTALGSAEGTHVWRDLVTYTLRHSSVIGPLISVATTVGLAAPWSFVKQVPRGWENTYRGYGVPEVVRTGDHAARVTWRGVPSYLFDHPVHYVAIRGALIGVVELSGHTTTAEFSMRREEQAVEAALEWSKTWAVGARTRDSMTRRSCEGRPAPRA